jgi:hypothetical protein
MNVINDAPFGILAFGWNINLSCENDVLILPGESSEIRIPFLGELVGGDCHTLLTREIVCHGKANDGYRQQILERAPLTIGCFEVGVHIRHYFDEAPPRFIKWRETEERDDQTRFWLMKAIVLN